MNLATNQVKNSVDLRSANNGSILKSSIASTFRTQHRTTGGLGGLKSSVAGLEFCVFAQGQK